MVTITSLLHWMVKTVDLSLRFRARQRVGTRKQLLDAAEREPDEDMGAYICGKAVSEDFSIVCVHDRETTKMRTQGMPI